jgi:hypothetical protein
MTETGAVSPTSQAWQRYYEDAAKRRGARGDVDHRRLRQLRNRRKKLERIWMVGSLAGVLLLAWFFARLLSR